jgi:hypothetical protein
MWVMLNNAFFSIVSKDCAPDELMVRARRPGDIEKVFPEAKVTEFTASDYHYRAAIKRTRIAYVLTNLVQEIDYSNFKNTVRDKPLHDAYLRVWNAMADLQPQEPYAGRRRQRATLFDDGMGGTYRPGAVIDAADRLYPFETAHLFATGHMPDDADFEPVDPKPTKTKKRKANKNTRGR